MLDIKQCALKTADTYITLFNLTWLTQKRGEATPPHGRDDVIN